MFVTQSAFEQGVEALEERLAETKQAVAATREQLHAEICAVEEEVGAARSDIESARQELQQVHDEMATESQVEELRGMMDEAQRTADRTHTQVTQLRGDVRTVIADVAALREVVDNAVQSMVVHQPTERPAEGAEKRRQQQRPAASASAPSCSAGVVASLVWTTGSALAASAGRGGRMEPGSALAH